MTGTTAHRRGLLQAHFVASARAIEQWDPVRLRELWNLPAETPLHAIAELLARLHHLESRDAERMASALRSSSVWPWVEQVEDLEELPAVLPAIYAYVLAGEDEADAS